MLQGPRQNRKKWVTGGGGCPEERPYDFSWAKSICDTSPINITPCLQLRTSQLTVARKPSTYFTDISITISMLKALNS